MRAGHRDPRPRPVLGEDVRGAPLLGHGVDVDRHASGGADVAPGGGREEHRRDAQPGAPSVPTIAPLFPGRPSLTMRTADAPASCALWALTLIRQVPRRDECDLAVPQVGEVAGAAAGVGRAGDRSHGPRRAATRRVRERPRLTARREPASAGEGDPRRTTLVEVREGNALHRDAPPGRAQRIHDVGTRRLVAGCPGGAGPGRPGGGGEGVEVRGDVAGVDRRGRPGDCRRRRRGGPGLTPADEHDRRHRAGDRGQQHRHRREGPPRTHTRSVAARSTLRT